MVSEGRKQPSQPLEAQREVIRNSVDQFFGRVGLLVGEHIGFGGNVFDEINRRRSKERSDKYIYVSPGNWSNQDSLYDTPWESGSLSDVPSIAEFVQPRGVGKYSFKYSKGSKFQKIDPVIDIQMHYTPIATHPRMEVRMGSSERPRGFSTALLELSASTFADKPYEAFTLRSFRATDADGSIDENLRVGTTTKLDVGLIALGQKIRIEQNGHQQFKPVYALELQYGDLTETGDASLVDDQRVHIKDGVGNHVYKGMYSQAEGTVAWQFSDWMVETPVVEMVRDEDVEVMTIQFEGRTFHFPTKININESLDSMLGVVDSALGNSSSGESRGHTTPSSF